MTEILPWQHAIFKHLTGLRDQVQLPHALLFSGLPGTGKQQFAHALAQAVLCQQPVTGGTACGICASCKLFIAGTHPDFSSVTVLEDKKYIAIDQIRLLGEKLSLKSHFQGYKVVVLGPAERMNRSAANSLLKTLEEPAGSTLIMLVTNRPGYLLPTIRSRCQTVAFPRPDDSVALEWLQSTLSAEDLQQHSAREYLDLAQGAPLRARTLAKGKLADKRQFFINQLNELLDGQQDAITAAKPWKKEDVPNNLNWMVSWVSDMLRLKFAPDSPLSYNKDILHILQGLALRTNASDLFKYLDRLSHSARLSEGQINQQLLLEDALICWSRLFSKQARTR